jgi:hypothetical protein
MKAESAPKGALEIAGGDTSTIAETALNPELARAVWSLICQFVDEARAAQARQDLGVTTEIVATARPILRNPRDAEVQERRRFTDEPCGSRLCVKRPCARCIRARSVRRRLAVGEPADYPGVAS